MLYWLGDILRDWFGPARLLLSRPVLASLGLGLGALCAWFLIPRLARLLPRDRGRAHAVNAALSAGKPTGAGIVLIPIFIFIALLVVPWYDASETVTQWHREPLGILACMALALATGFADDRGKRPWGDLRKGLTDFAIAIAASASLCQLGPMKLWLPFVAGDAAAWEVPAFAYIAVGSAVLWLSINCTNCTDGVDGLSGILLLFAFLYLAVLLYLVVGHRDVSAHLLVPHARLGADWAIMAFTMMGVLIGYLWYNAEPSSVLMGDAGSRPLGLLLGVLAMATGNPLLLFVVAGVVLVNGGGGLLKVALLRFFKVGIFRNVRFPLHDHCRKNLGWSNTQVLVRFLLLQAVLAPIVIVFFIKIR